MWVVYATAWTNLLAFVTGVVAMGVFVGTMYYEVRVLVLELICSHVVKLILVGASLSVAAGGLVGGWVGYVCER